MTEAEIAARLEATGLRLPAHELPAFAALVRDMMAAAAVAQRPLGYGDEPSNVFRLADGRLAEDRA